MSSLAEREHGRDLASQFMNDYEARGVTIETQKDMIVTHTATIAELSNKVDLLTAALSREKTDSNRWLQYCVELSAQLKFVVSGAVRALTIADEVQAVVAQKADAHSKPVRGADLAELESLLKRAAAKPDIMPGILSSPGVDVLALQPVMQAEDLPALNEIKAALSPEPIPQDAYTLVDTNGWHQFVDENGDNKGVEFRAYWMLRYDEFPSWYSMEEIPPGTPRLPINGNEFVDCEITAPLPSFLTQAADTIKQQSTALDHLNKIGR